MSRNSTRKLEEKKDGTHVCAHNAPCPLQRPRHRGDGGVGMTVVATREEKRELILNGVS